MAKSKNTIESRIDYSILLPVLILLLVGLVSIFIATNFDYRKNLGTDGRDSVTTKRVKHRDTYEVSEPGVGSGSDRGKLVPKSGMEDGEKSCVYFCGARTANRHR